MEVVVLYTSVYCVYPESLQEKREQVGRFVTTRQRHRRRRRRQAVRSQNGRGHIQFRLCEQYTSLDRIRKHRGFHYKNTKKWKIPRRPFFSLFFFLILFCFPPFGSSTKIFYVPCQKTFLHLTQRLYDAEVVRGVGTFSSSAPPWRRRKSHGTSLPHLGTFSETLHLMIRNFEKRPSCIWCDPGSQGTTLVFWRLREHSEVDYTSQGARGRSDRKGYLTFAELRSTLESVKEILTKSSRLWFVRYTKDYAVSITSVNKLLS